MKKIGMMLVAGALMITPSFAAFSDVPLEHWAYSAISKMEEVEILSGYEDGSFKPSNNITLAEFATIFTKLFEISPDNVSNYFTDIPVTHWAKGSTEAIREYINPFYDSIGEALGVTDYSYLKGLPGDIEMTREAFIYAVSRIYGYEECLYTEGEEKILFADYEELLYPKETVLAYKNKVISGEVIDGKTYIKPKRCITRAEASAIFRNLLKYEQKRITNKNEEPQLTAAFSVLVKQLKTEGIVSAKDFIYDTQKILSSKKLVLSDSQLNALDELLDVALSKFEYEVVDKGFYSFNKGYIKVKVKCYDIIDRIKEIDIENVDVEVFAREIKNGIANREIKEIEKEEVFNFAKQDGEWKLILK